MMREEGFRLDAGWNEGIEWRDTTWPLHVKRSFLIVIRCPETLYSMKIMMNQSK